MFWTPPRAEEWLFWVQDQESGAVPPFPVLGCVVAVAGIAEVPWEVPWRPLLLVGNLFDDCLGPPRTGWSCSPGWWTRRVASLFFLHCAVAKAISEAMGGHVRS